MGPMNVIYRDIRAGSLCAKYSPFVEADVPICRHDVYSMIFLASQRALKLDMVDIITTID